METPLRWIPSKIFHNERKWQTAKKDDVCSETAPTRNWILFIFMSPYGGKNFALAMDNITNGNDENKGTQEEVGQQLMRVCTVQCVCSWFACVGKKWKDLLYSVAPLLPPLSLILPCCIDLLWSLRAEEEWSCLFCCFVSCICWKN